jgi:hypothetical protein
MELVLDGEPAPIYKVESGGMFPLHGAAPCVFAQPNTFS